MAMMCSARLMRRFPAWESRCRCWLPEDASSRPVPFQEANRSRSAKRWMSSVLSDAPRGGVALGDVGDVPEADPVIGSTYGFSTPAALLRWAKAPC